MCGRWHDWRGELGALLAVSCIVLGVIGFMVDGVIYVFMALNCL